MNDSPAVIVQPALAPIKKKSMPVHIILLWMLITFLALLGFVILVLMILRAIHDDA